MKIKNLILKLNLLIIIIISSLIINASKIHAKEINHPPDLNDAILLKKEVKYIVPDSSNNFSTLEHSPEFAHTLDFSTNEINDYSKFFVSITTHLYLKFLVGKGATYFVQMTISMNNINYDYEFRPNDSDGYLAYAETNIPLNAKQYKSEEFFASLFTDENSLIVKNRQWIEMSFNYDKYTHDYTTRSGIIFFYSYKHYYKKESKRTDIVDYNNDSFTFRGGNSVLYNFDFSNLDASI